MIDFWRLFLQSLLILVFVTFITWVTISILDASEAQTPATYGIGIAYLNALIGYALLYWGFRGSTKRLMAAVFGGMILMILLNLKKTIQAINLKTNPIQTLKTPLKANQTM